MKSTKDIINQMEKEFDEKLAELKCADYSTEEVVDFGFRYKIGDEIGKAVDWAYIKSFIHSYIRTLLESFGEEVIGEDETEVNQIARDEKLGVQTYYVITANMKRRNQLRAEQRLKVKEILEVIK